MLRVYILLTLHTNITFTFIIITVFIIIIIISNSMSIIMITIIINISLTIIVLPQACRQTLAKSFGFIISPLYPGYYPNNVTCSWHVTTEENRTIRLHFQSFAIEPHPTCANDYVEVREGGINWSRTIGKYCGHTYPPVIESSSNTLTIIFRANEAGINTGFKANYTTKPGKTCSVVLSILLVLSLSATRYFLSLFYH